MELSEQQKAAVEAEEPRIAVLAAPGSGKTRVLTERIKHMITERSISPSSIAAITFTRFAANVLKERLGPWARQMGYVGTYHALCLEIVQQFGHTVGWEPEWLTIMDEEEARLEEMDILRDLGIISRKGAWMKCKSMEWCQFRDDILNGDFDKHGELTRTERLLSIAWDSFCNRLRAENCLTFGTLVLEAHSLLHDPEINAQVRKVYKHLLIDEVQDCSQNEWNFMELLNPESLSCVGDIDQSIYSFRGAKPNLFIEYINKVKRYDLSESYRFGFNIGKAASALIRNNENRLDMAINAISSNKGSLDVIHGARFQDVAQIIKGEIKSGVDPQDIAVLARKHVTLDCLAMELQYQGVPFTQVGGPSHITSTAEFRVVKGYMRLAVNEHDRWAFMATTAIEGISTDEIWELREKALKDDVSLYQAYCNDGNAKFPVEYTEIKDYLTKKESMTNFYDSLVYLDELRVEQGLYELQDMINHLQLMSMQDMMRKKAEDVTLATCHSSKGLEWKQVFVVGLNQDTFPSKRSIAEGNMEDERRLLYVSLTRGMEKVWMIANEPAGIQSTPKPPSPFFEEIGGYTLRRAPSALKAAEDAIPM